MEKIYLTKNSNQTKKLGEFFAKKISKLKPKKQAVVLGLIGDLGGGKTTFLQGFAKGLGIKEKILSPTFVIMRKYEVRSMKKRKDIRRFMFYASCFFHVDCYRIEKPKEILELGFQEIASNPQNIMAIEWADRIKKILPKNAIWIKFDFISKEKRQIVIKNLKY